jgi:hypothetical protein
MSKQVMPKQVMPKPVMTKPIMLNPVMLKGTGFSLTLPCCEVKGAFAPEASASEETALLYLTIHRPAVAAGTMIFAVPMFSCLS